MPSNLNTLLTLLMLHACSVLDALDWPETSFELLPGHYPSVYCQFSNVVFQPESDGGAFLYRSSVDHHRECHGVNDIWPLRNDPSLTSVSCDDTYDVGHVFTIFYWGTGSNYFHLHYDMMIPLYAAAYHAGKLAEGGRQIFMPSVETTRLKVCCVLVVF